MSARVSQAEAGAMALELRELATCLGRYESFAKLKPPTGASLERRIENLVEHHAEAAKPAVNHFFIVWSPEGKTPPRIRHETREDATAEAERLARSNPGDFFYVLESLTESRAPVPTNITSPVDWSIPF